MIFSRHHLSVVVCEKENNSARSTNMLSIIKPILKFFNAQKTVYSHRNRTIELIALEKNIDIAAVKGEAKTILKNKGRTEAILQLTKRFHVPLATAWAFIDKLD